MDPQLKVLIVDDDRDLSFNLKDILEGEGYGAEVAETGAAALASARGRAFDLAVVDVRLPDTPGVALIERLLEFCPSMESILITGFASLETAVAAIRQKSIIAYETKPVDIDRLIALLGQVAQRKRLERRLFDAGEQERARIGRELHDGLGQNLTGIGLHVRVLTDALKSKKIPEAEGAERIARMINEAIAEAGRLARGLAPVVLETKGLKAALEDLAAQAETAGGIRCRLEWDADIRDPEGDVAMHSYRLVQEAVNNAAKHARAKTVRIAVSRENPETVVEVSDDGIGLSRNASEGTGMGLHFMRQRAVAIGASLDVAPNGNGGTLIRVRCRRWSREPEKG